MNPKRLTTLSRFLAVLSMFVLMATLTHPLGAVDSVRAAAGDITRLSVSSSEAQANSYSRFADISGDARFIVFQSEASNLVSGDTNGFEDVFLRDRQTGETFRISVTSSGAQANNGSFSPAISSDGRFVAFNSDATNLVSGDTNGFTDIFVRDRQSGTNTRVTISSNGTQANDNTESRLAISGDGRFIAFHSDATNLVSGDSNAVSDVFVHDRQTGVTERISLNSNEVQGNDQSFNPSISADGRFVAFTSGATNLVSGDTNARTDIFVRDRAQGVTTRVSVNSSGVEADRGGRDASISGDGRYVAFSSAATNMLEEEHLGFEHVYVHDRQTGATTLASIQSDGYQMVGTSLAPDISTDGRFVAFEFEDRSDGIAFLAIHLHDRQTGITSSLSGPGGSEDDSSFGPAISASGAFVAFASQNRRLVPNDTNEVSDIFLCEVAVIQPVKKTYQSLGDYDGWIIETGEENETGVRIDERANTFFLGDANNDQQYRSILHFGTSSLPNNAVITRVTLKIKRQGIVGENPFNTHGDILVDIRKPFFNSAAKLQAADFQAAADLGAVGAMPYAPGAAWYTAILDPIAFPYINLTGTTQFRLRFELDDNDDHEQDYMKFFSGNAGATDQPVLTINYHLSSAGVPRVIAVTRADVNPTVASSRRYIVGFSEPVTGVDVNDFALTTTGGIRNASVTGVSGAGDTYMVTVGTGTGSGTIRLDVTDNDSILDSTGNRLGGPGTGNGNYTAGEIYNIVRPNTEIYVGTAKQGSYYLTPHGSMRASFAGISNGPVKLVNTDGTSMMAAERVIYEVGGVDTSFTETMGLPANQLDTTYWLPWYNNLDLDTQLRFANVSGSTATVHVSIAGVEMSGSPFTLAPGASVRKNFAINGGPVKIESNVDIVAAERVIYNVNGSPTSFSEMMAQPDSQLDTTYWLPWYNNVDQDTELRIANVNGAPATVHVTIGGETMPGSPFTLAAGESIQKSFADVDSGPVKIESNVDIVATQRVIYNVNGTESSFTEIMGRPESQLDTIYWLPWYNSKTLDTQLRIANVSNAETNVHIFIGVVEVTGSPFTLAAGESIQKSFANIDKGPVKVVSDYHIVVTERVIHRVNGTPVSLSEMMGLPNSQLDTTYWLPWYNNKELDTQLRFGIP